jgi:uncharacterized BrkB/YihY/UPF0761 family membrane protein
MFESFNELTRGSDDRALENHSLRSLFLWLLISVFLLGTLTAEVLFQALQQHRFDWSGILAAFPIGLIAFQLIRLLYRRLPD